MVCVLLHVCVCVHMAKIILSISILFEVGGLDGSSEHHIAAICESEGRSQTLLFFVYYSF